MKSYPRALIALRSECPAVLLPAQRVYDGVLQGSNWILTAGGATMFCAPGQVEILDDNLQRGFMLFDPFYSIDADPPWDQEQTRGLLLFGGDDLNPTGIVGTWLNSDAVVPDNDFEGFGDGSALGDLSFPRRLWRMVEHTSA